MVRRRLEGETTINYVVVLLDGIFSHHFSSCLPSGSLSLSLCGYSSSLTSSLGPEQLDFVARTFCATQKLSKHLSLLCVHTATKTKTKISACKHHTLSLTKLKVLLLAFSGAFKLSISCYCVIKVSYMMTTALSS